MSWNPNQGQAPNQQSQYGGYAPPPQQGNPYSDQQYEQPSGYGQQQYGAYGQQQQYGGYGQQQYGGYQQPYGTPPMANASPLGPSSIGMDPKVSAGLSYLIGILGIIFFFIEKQNRFVRFHALQAILLGISIAVAYILLVILGIVSAFISGNLAGLILSLGSLVIWGGSILGWLIAMINAFQGKYFKLPVIGDYAEKWSSRGMTSM